MSGPVEVSIVVPAYNATKTLGDCVKALLEQDTRTPYEVIVVASADGAADIPELPEDPMLRLVTSVPRMGAAAARNRGVQIARGRTLVFTDADVVAPPQWLSTLLAESDGGRACVAGSVRNGTPRSAVGTTEYLVGFLDLNPARPPRTAWHGATCNLLIPREMWEVLGPWPEDMDGGEDTLLTVKARALGRFRFAPAAWVTHLNRTRLGAVLHHQYEAGSFTARLARRSAYKWRPLVRYTPLAPVAAAGRFVSLYARVLAWTPRPIALSFLVAPLVALALGAWGVGLAVEGGRLDARTVRTRLAR
jgi:GT2 family glycosyltransferase